MSSLSKGVFFVWLVGITNLASVIAHVLQGDELKSPSFALNLLTMAVLFPVRHYIMRVNKSVNTLISHAKKWQQGDISGRIDNDSEKGNISGLFGALNQFIDVVDTFLRESISSMHAVGQGKYDKTLNEEEYRGVFNQSAKGINQGVAIAAEKAKSLTKASIHLETSVSQTINSVTRGAKQVRGVSESMVSRIKQAIEKGTLVSDHAQLTKGNVEVVMYALEELTTAVKGIDGQIEQVMDRVVVARDRTQYATEIMKQLSSVSTQINDVVSIISTIADQTNLLAINATIEAAREGEAGKGFGVVALEVKNLATQTVKAADQIIQQLSVIQKSSHQAGEAITEVNTIINNVNDAFLSVSSAAKQQNTTVGNISSNIRELALSTTTVSHNISDILKVDNESFDFAKEVFQEIHDLANKINVLHTNVDSFMHQLSGNSVNHNPSVAHHHGDEVFDASLDHHSVN